MFSWARDVCKSVFAAAIINGVCSQLCLANSDTVLSIGEVSTQVSGWTVGKNLTSGGCLAAATYQDETTAWVGFDRDGKGVLGFTNPKWKSIDVGQQYAIQLRARGRASWVGNFVGTARKDEKGIIISNVKIDFLIDFAKAGGISVFIEGKPVTRLSLGGSNSAIDAAYTCNNGGSTAGASPTDQPRKDHESESEYSGTGFFVSSNGHLLTNNHVIKGCTRFTASIAGGLPQKASVLAADETNDLALLIIDAKPTFVPAFDTRPKVGEAIYVYGFPLTGVLASTGNFTVGNITATAGLNDDTRMLQISAPVQPGNSGGPVIDQNGNILGVIVSKLNAMKFAKVTNDIPQNVNFSIKSSIATNFLESNGITPNTKKSDMSLDPTNVAELARMFTIRLVCQ
jgi:S1-C subfamily serine protease